jgi:Chaperone of endosialidase
MVTGTFSNPSDQKLKTNIRPVSRSSSPDKVKSIHIYQYEYDRVHFPFISFSEGTQTGVIAKELQELFPDLVHKNVHPEYVPVNEDDPRPASPEFEYLGVNTIGLTSHLISPILEQQVLIEQLHQTITELMAKK